MFLVLVDVVPKAEIDFLLHSAAPEKVKRPADSRDSVGVMLVLKSFGDHEGSARGTTQFLGPRCGVGGGCAPAVLK